LPAVRRSDSRFDLLDLCARNMHATSEAAALAWAPPEAQVFYRDERERREAAEAQAQDANDPMMQQMATQQAQMANDMAMQAAQLANDMATQAAAAATQQATQMATPSP
jgi:hypothetical protein